MKQSKQKTNVQVALDEDIRDKAILKAKKYGFDNLPTMVRYIVINVVNDELIPTRLRDPGLPYVDEETEKNIGIALREYERGEYDTLKSKKEIKGYFKKLNSEL